MSQALLREVDGDKVLCAPTVGWFVYAIQAGDGVQAGRLLGHLWTLNRKVAVHAPSGARGVVIDGPGPGRVGVEYGQALVTLGDPVAGSDAEEASAAAASSAGHHELKAPIDGIFYTRPSPDAPSFVSVGDRVTDGTTLGLVEVMKTFNPVRYGGLGAPAEGIVEAVRAIDQDEVSAGQVLFVIRDATS